MAKSSYHHGNLRRALLDAAIEIIDARGVPALTMAALARAAGVSSGAPYRHFKSIDGVLAALANDGWRLLAAEEAALAARATGPLERFRLAGVATVRFAVQHPVLYRLMCTPDGRQSADPELRARMEAGEAQTRAMVAAAVDAQEMGQGDVEAQTLAAQALVYGLARLLVDGVLPPLGPDEAERLAYAITGVLGVGLRPR